MCKAYLSLVQIWPCLILFFVFVFLFFLGTLSTLSIISHAVDLIGYIFAFYKTGHWFNTVSIYIIRMMMTRRVDGWGRYMSSNLNGYRHYLHF